jgi:hypothetical protein
MSLSFFKPRLMKPTVDISTSLTSALLGILLHAPTVLLAGKWPHFVLSMMLYGPQKICVFGGETKICSAFVRHQTQFMA